MFDNLEEQELKPSQSIQTAVNNLWHFINMAAELIRDLRQENDKLRKIPKESNNYYFDFDTETIQQEKDSYYTFKVEELEKVIINLREKNSELEEQINFLNKKIENDNSEKIFAELQIAQNDIIEKNHLINKLNQEIIDLKNQLAEVQNNELRFLEFSKRIEELNSINTKYDDELSIAKDEIKKLRQEFETEIQRLNEELETSINIQDELRSDIEVKDARLHELNDSLKTLKAEYEAQKNNFEAIKASDFNLRQINLELEEKLKENKNIELKLLEVQNEIKLKDNIITELTEKIQSLSAELTQIDEYENKIRQIETEKDEIEKKLIELKQYQSEFHRLQNELVQLQSKLSEKDSQVNLLNNEKLNLENKLFSALKEKSNLNTLKENLNNKIAELQDLLLSKDEIITMQQERIKNYETINIEKEIQKQTLINNIESYLEKIEKRINS